mmetsp:Transcript_32276/g.91515  ORF Transcript_32276/g.91515 Transcript_32276/m.91515 type:complete len:220 (+) Transcript_32276:1744-2403(+)
MRKCMAKTVAPGQGRRTQWSMAGLEGTSATGMTAPPTLRGAAAPWATTTGAAAAAAMVRVRRAARRPRSRKPSAGHPPTTASSMPRSSWTSSRPCLPQLQWPPLGPQRSPDQRQAWRLRKPSGGYLPQAQAAARGRLLATTATEGSGCSPPQSPLTAGWALARGTQGTAASDLARGTPQMRRTTPTAATATSLLALRASPHPMTSTVPQRAKAQGEAAL